MKQIHLTVNAETGVLLDPDTRTRITRAEDLPQLFLGETIVLCLQFINSSGDAVAFDAADTFECSVDQNYIHGNDPLMCYSDSTQTDLTSDWSGADRSAGKISIRLSCNTNEFQQKLGSAGQIEGLIEIRHFPDGGTAGSVILLDRAILRNIVNFNENTPEESTAGSYFTKTEIQALLAARHHDFPFTTSAADNQTSVSLLKQDLDVSGNPDVSLWKAESSGGFAKVPDSTVSMAWNSTSLVLTSSTVFPDASWVLKF